MAIPSSSATENDAVAQKTESNKVESNAVVQLNRVRVVGGRTDELKTAGTSCHQCRQKTLNFSATCTNPKKKGVCTIKFCHKCLLNRYGEIAEAVERLGNWICPKCKGICNCSVCMKLKGHKPTGLLAPIAMKSGFKSVSEMLSAKGAENMDLNMDVESKVTSPKKAVASDQVSYEKRVDSKEMEEELKETCNGSKGGGGDGSNNAAKAKKAVSSDQEPADRQVDSKEVKKTKGGKLKETCTGSKDGGGAGTINAAKAKANAKVKAAKALRKAKKCSISYKDNNVIDRDLPLPLGNPLASIAGIELAPEDAGNALQFLKFCETFEEVLNFNKSQAETLLRELSRQTSGRRGRPGQYSSVARFHTLLVSFIQEDVAEESSSSDQLSRNSLWFQDLGNCISESEISDHVLKELPQNCFRKGGDGYDSLNFSQKLRLLTFLCDEALGSNTLRSWIDKQIETNVEAEKETKKKVAAAKDKEKQLKNKLQDEREKRKAADSHDTVSLSEHASIVAQLESEKAQAHAEVVEAVAMLPERKLEALRAEPYLLDAEGHAFWKLKCHDSEDILLQDLGTRDGVSLEDKWFVYGSEMKEPIEKYFSSLTLREREGARRKRLPETPLEACEEEIQPSPVIH